jgi:hypothetical protein
MPAVIKVLSGTSSATFTYSTSFVGEDKHRITVARISGDELPGGDSKKFEITVEETARNRYVNQGISEYNKIQLKKILEEKLRNESEMVKQDSLLVLNDFENYNRGN